MPKKKRKRKEKHLSIPSRLKIRGKSWKIYTEPNLPKWAKREKLTLKGEDAWAVTFPSKQEIFLAGDLADKPRIRDMALVHEILHAALPTKNHERLRVVGPNVEERIVSELAPTLTRILKQLKWK